MYVCVFTMHGLLVHEGPNVLFLLPALKILVHGTHGSCEQTHMQTCNVVMHKTRIACCHAEHRMWCPALAVFPLRMQADAERLTTWLPHVRWAPTNTHVGIQVSVPWLGSLPLTQAHLSMLRAVRFHTPAAAQKTVLILRHWHMNTSGIDLLQSLPAWAGPIWFRECTWPLKDAQYCRFGQTISTSYRMWSFGEAPIGAVQSMCAAADRVRAGLGLPRLIVYSKEHQGADRVWENVTLTGNWPQSEM